jgi:hypothetical protein
MDFSRKAYMVQCTQHKINEYTRAIELATTPEIKDAYTVILALHISQMETHKKELAALLSTITDVNTATK